MPTPCHVAHHGRCADTLKAEGITFTLDLHHVENYTTAEGIVYAFESATIKGHDGVVRDASEWIKAPTTVHDLAAWLGY